MARPVATKISTHVVTALLGGLVAFGFNRHLAVEMGDFSLADVTADQVVAGIAMPAVITGIIFLMAHLFMRELPQGRRSAYAGAGAAATLAGFFSVMSSDLLDATLERGVLSIVVALVAGTGAIAGFVHYRSAGFEFDDDESSKLGAKHDLEMSRRESYVLNGDVQWAGDSGMSPDSSDDLAHIATQDDEFFDGPLQVITSQSALVTAALIGGVVWTVTMFLVMTVFSRSGFEKIATDVLDGSMFTRVGQSLIFGCLVALFVLTPIIYGTHLVARMRGKWTMGSYVFYGAMAPIAIGLALFIVGVAVTVQFVPAMAVAMGVYYRLAGLEPVDLPDDIEVRDRRALVGANHVRRRYRRIVS